MGKIISIANQKGGTAKSTTAVHLAAALKISGKKVLLADFDPQGDTSAYMGFTEDEAASINNLMQEFISGRSVNIRDIIRTSEKNDGIEYIPADIGLASAEFVKDGLTDEEAEIYVIETNAMQRGFNDLSISEQSAVIAYRHSKMFTDEKAEAIRTELQNLEGGITEDNTENAVFVNQNGKSKLAAVGTEYNLSKNSVARLIRISKLTGELIPSIDLKLLPVRAGVELSYIPQNAQKAIFEYCKETVIRDGKEYQAVRIDMKSAPALRELFEGYEGDTSTAVKMLESYFKGTEDKPKKPKPRKLNADIYSKYFAEEDTDEYIGSVIDEALQMYFEREKETIQ